MQNRKPWQHENNVVKKPHPENQKPHPAPPLKGEGNSPPPMGEDQGGGKPKIKHYSQETVKHSRQLRKNPTEAEKRLWRHIRDKQLNAHKFRRQFPIGSYIVDFICVEKRLIIEVDGGQHADSAYDKKRDIDLKAQNYHIIRFWNHDVLQNTEGVLQEIISSLQT